MGRDQIATRCLLPPSRNTIQMILFIGVESIRRGEGFTCELILFLERYSQGNQHYTKST